MTCCRAKQKDQSNLLRDVYKHPNRDAIAMLSEYLNNISGKKLKINFIRQILFKISWTEKEILTRTRCHLQAASQYLNFLLQSKNISKAQVRTVIADLCKYINQVDPKQYTGFILVSTNTLPSRIHYKHAEALFYEHDLPQDSRSNYDLDLLVIYSLRLSLEKRVNGIIGVDHVRNRNQVIGLSRIIEIVKSLKRIEYSDAIDWTEIEWLNKWLNHHMHRHIRPYPWIIHQAFEILNSILLPGEHAKDGKTTFSFYAATVVESYKSLREEFLNKLKTKYPEVEVIWSNTKELFEIKKNSE